MYFIFLPLDCQLKQTEFTPFIFILYYHISISLRMAAIWIKVFEKLRFSAVSNLVNIQHFQLLIQNAWLQETIVAVDCSNHLTQRKLKGISEKIMFISIIWYLWVPCVTTGLVTGSSQSGPPVVQNFPFLESRISIRWGFYGTTLKISNTVKAEEQSL